MVTKRIRSEYMKKFKDPKWETFSKCYEEMLRYRLGRRLLEHAHNPWFWSGSDSDSETGGRSPPASGGDQVQWQRGPWQTEACMEEREDQNQQQQHSHVPRLPLLEEEENVSACHGSPPDCEARTPVEREEQRSTSRTRAQAPETDPGGPQTSHSKPPKHSKQTWCSQRVKPPLSRHSKEDSMDGKHPFALYGSGEKQADIADRKTHNVCPVASTTEIHESALRAKTRREAERQIQAQRNERRRAKSANSDKARKLAQPEFNPWLTEYMRCFSARSR